MNPCSLRENQQPIECYFVVLERETGKHVREVFAFERREAECTCDRRIRICDMWCRYSDLIDQKIDVVI